MDEKSSPFSIVSKLLKENKPNSILDEQNGCCSNKG